MLYYLIYNIRFIFFNSKSDPVYLSVARPYPSESCNYHFTKHYLYSITSMGGDVIEG